MNVILSKYYSNEAATKLRKKMDTKKHKKMFRPIYIYSWAIFNLRSLIRRKIFLGLKALVSSINDQQWATFHHIYNITTTYIKSKADYGRPCVRPTKIHHIICMWAVEKVLGDDTAKGRLSRAPHNWWTTKETTVKTELMKNFILVWK